MKKQKTSVRKPTARNIFELFDTRLTAFCTISFILLVIITTMSPKIHTFMTDIRTNDHQNKAKLADREYREFVAKSRSDKVAKQREIDNINHKILANLKEQLSGKSPPP